MIYNAPLNGAPLNCVFLPSEPTPLLPRSRLAVALVAQVLEDVHPDHELVLGAEVRRVQVRGLPELHLRAERGQHCEWCTIILERTIKWCTLSAARERGGSTRTAHRYHKYFL